MPSARRKVQMHSARMYSRQELTHGRSNRVRNGQASSAMVLGADLSPTILDPARVEPSKGMQEKSVMQLAEGEDTEWRRAVCAKPRKLIHHYAEPQEFKMYDPVNGPGERRNLYGDPAHASVQKYLTAEIQQPLENTLRGVARIKLSKMLTRSYWDGSRTS